MPYPPLLLRNWPVVYHSRSSDICRFFWMVCSLYSIITVQFPAAGADLHTCRLPLHGNQTLTSACKPEISFAGLQVLL